jgi:putative transposase
MNEFLAQFATTLARDEHAILVLDRAGWHKAKALVVPNNVTLVWLPPYSPRLNSVVQLARLTGQSGRHGAFLLLAAGTAAPL